MIREKEILTYLDGEASPELVASIEAWAKEDAENQTTLDFYKSLWTADVYQNDAIDFGVEDAWNAISSKISDTPSTSSIPTATNKQEEIETISKEAKVLPLWKKALSIAAVFIFLASAFFLLRDNDPYLYADTPGVIELEDGSTVTLAENSSLKYPKSFEKFDERLVSLKGNATFEIAKNPDKPFIAEYYKTRTKVLGTIFSITGDSSKSEVENIEGLIKFYVKGKESEAITLKKGEKAVFDGNGINQILPEPAAEPAVEPAAERKAESIPERKSEPAPESASRETKPETAKVEPEQIKEAPKSEPVNEAPEPAKEIEGMQDGKLLREVAKKFPKMLKISDAFGYSGEKIPFNLSLLESGDFETIMAAIEKEADLDITKKTKKGAYHIKGVKLKE